MDEYNENECSLHKNYHSITLLHIFTYPLYIGFIAAVCPLLPICALPVYTVVPRLLTPDWLILPAWGCEPSWDEAELTVTTPCDLWPIPAPIPATAPDPIAMFRLRWISALVSPSSARNVMLISPMSGMGSSGGTYMAKLWNKNTPLDTSVTQKIQS